MRFSALYTKTNRSAATQDSVNATLLVKAGYVAQAAAGVYTLLPLGLMVVERLSTIIREEMNHIGATELLMPSLQPRALWETTDRWKKLNDILFIDRKEQYLFAPTHEELLTQILSHEVKSYKDLPIALFQIQTKFRNEPRAKSGLLRGREFLMKDLYSFHPNLKEHNLFYEKAAVAYKTIFQRIGLESLRIKASGGAFSKEYSDEFQVLSDQGEDEIYYDSQKRAGYNKEIIDSIDTKELKKLKKAQGIEVGNIFHLGTQFSEALNLTYLDRSGKRHPVVMGSYGIGITRLLGTLAEVYHDNAGLTLPTTVAPFEVVVIDLTESGTGEKLTAELEKSGMRVLLDDRDESPGSKFVDADLIGVPIRVVYSHKTAQDGKVEIKQRTESTARLIDREELTADVGKILS